MEPKIFNEFLMVNVMKYRFILILLSSSILVSCATQEPAPVEHRTSITSLSSPSKKSNVSEISSKRLDFDDLKKNDRSLGDGSEGGVERVNISKKNDRPREEENYLNDKRDRNAKYIKEDTEEDNLSSTPSNKTDQIKTSKAEKVIEEGEDLESELESIKENAKNAKPKTSPKNEQKIENIKEVPIKKDVAQAYDQSPNELIQEDVLPIAEPVLIKPIKARISSKYGDLKNGVKNTGIDFVADTGDTVTSAASGVIAHVGKDTKFGNIVIIKHENLDLQTAYAHLGTVNVSKGQVVSSGDKIGAVGLASGDDAVPTLHFAVRKGKVSVDPMSYFKSE